MKMYEVEGTLNTIVRANSGEEAIKKVEEKQTHGEILNMSAIEVESSKANISSDFSKLEHEFKILEEKYGVSRIGVTYIPNTFERVLSVGLNNYTFFDMFSGEKIDKTSIEGTKSEYLSIIFDGVEYHTVLLRD
jgi:hypothetical protein